MSELAHVLQNLGFLLYGGPMVAFTILVAAAHTIPNMNTWDVVRTYRSWGAGLGLALGACVFGGLARFYLHFGGFLDVWDQPDAQAYIPTLVAFFLMWASNIKLEIWTLEPLRKLDKEGVIADEAAYEVARAALARHMSVQSTLVLAIAVFATTSGIA